VHKESGYGRTEDCGFAPILLPEIQCRIFYYGRDWEVFMNISGRVPDLLLMVELILLNICRVI